MNKTLKERIKIAKEEFLTKDTDKIIFVKNDIEEKLLESLRNGKTYLSILINEFKLTYAEVDKIKLWLTENGVRSSLFNSSNDTYLYLTIENNV